ncbi:ABC transporter substrate-binding protein [Vibrio hannami]|uniref:ABC transporter substrate-binding protein n=1 Tax=Vibrio hannami TaxID=2717094 RepID=UPI00240F554D|nr:ABC transporter substrate-binding protein [Vibrio hannami]MDG3085116.1 ABC transporter substrate-binding protein [Vibrio hannami]
MTKFNKCVTKLFCFLFTTISCVSVASDEADRMHVVFLNPAHPNDWFWSMTTDFMQASAEDLGIEFEVIYSNRNHKKVVRQAKEVVNRETPPDYILTGNEKGSAGGVIEVAESAGVKVFLFNNPFVSKSDRAHFGQPRDKYVMWIGQYSVNNFFAGYKMGEALIKQGIEKNLFAPDKTLHIVAISGSRNTHASSARVAGLEAVIGAYSERAKLLQVVSSDWSEKNAYDKTKRLLTRYKHIGAVWGANDSIALGAIKAAEEFGKVPGKDMIFAGCGWSEKGINKVKEGVLATTVGGHFMDGAWSLVMLYDYHYGYDFTRNTMNSDMHSIERHNAESFIEYFGFRDWSRIDFLRFSKKHNPTMKRYDFSLETVLEQLN